MVDEEFKIVRTPNFSKYYVTNLLVNSTDVDIRLEIMNEKFPGRKDDEEESVDDYISDALIMFTPEAAKKLRQRLEEVLADYEGEHGEIKVTREIP
ncbi:MAG TPA: DUF3467 domain-containing protein [Euryarchaeota archaeon]|nr:hypothetical protein BMS3Bbin15_00750 [archaeon BMS3Bbin15]HDL15634.1 DUF3467 domain-containing protein [Euryarchaeota archaeon]